MIHLLNEEQEGAELSQAHFKLYPAILNNYSD